MDKNILLNGFIVSFIFLIVKFIEMRFITKKNVPPKLLFRDALLVYAAFIMAYYIMRQIHSKKTREFVEVFTDTPNF